MGRREIKFRFYSNAEKKMYNMGLMGLNTSHEKNPCMYSAEKLVKEDGGTRCQYLDDGHLMQFTWLKDKNGAEVYEGDIVKGLNRITDNDIPHKVTFLNGCFMFGNWNAHEYFNKHQFIEVIGNIHEHPHLPEDKA